MEALDPKDLQPQTMLGMKLIQQPFSKIPDAENLFDFDALKQTRDTVSHHLQFSHLLMVVQGRTGSGRNSFANSLIVGDHPALYFFNANAQDDDTLSSLLAKAAENNHADSIAALEQRIDDIMFRGQQPVLIINDAEQVPEKQLHDLIQYTQSKKDENQQIQLKLLLLGDHSLEKKLSHNSSINHNQFYIIELPGLNISNTRGFLMHRLTLAGFRDADPFSDKDISNIHNMSNGNIVATMEYAAETLNNNKLLLADETSHQHKAKNWLLIFAGVVFIAAIIYNSLLTAPDDSTTDHKDNSTALELPVQQQRKAVEQLFTASTNTMDVKQATPTLTIPKLSQQQHTTAPANTETDVSQIIHSMKLAEPTTQTTDTIKKTAPVPADPIHPDPVHPVQHKDQNSSGIVSPEESKTVTIKAQSPTTQNTPGPVSKVQTVTHPKQDKVTRLFIDAGAKSPDWLLSLPQKNWSLQILAARQPETLLSFIQNNQLRGKVAYYRTQFSQKDWHVLLYGQYRSKETAKGAIPYLPKVMQQNNPWAKDMKSIQSAIKKYKK